MAALPVGVCVPAAKIGDLILAKAKLGQKPYCRQKHIRLQILIRHLNENMDCYRKIYEANKDGELMGILRNGLLLIFTKKLEDAEKDGIKAKIAYPILSCLLTDFFFSVIKCYLELSSQFDTDVFIENICRFAERDFFTE